jgi:hypothetical protein
VQSPENSCRRSPNGFAAPNSRRRSDTKRAESTGSASRPPQAAGTVRGWLPAGGLPCTNAAAADQLTGRGLIYLARLDEALSADLSTAQALELLTRLSRDPKLSAHDLAILVSAAEASLAIGLPDLVPADLDLSATEAALERDEIGMVPGGAVAVAGRGHRV